MELSNQIPAPKEPQKADCPSASCSGFWIPATTKPTGWERKVLVWVVWPQYGWPQWPEPLIGWWKHSPGCFAVGNVENADHLVTHWMDISEPKAESIHPESKPASEEQPTDERLDSEACSVSSYLESLNERAAEWEAWGEGRLDGYRAGYADALRKVSEELRSFSENA